MVKGVVPVALLSPPDSVSEAEIVFAAAVDWIGPDFDPDGPLPQYNGDTDWQAPEHPRAKVELVEHAIKRARAILGPRAYDVAYRESVRALQNGDPDWVEYGEPRPRTQPPARWWLIKRTRPSPDSVAYEDAEGTWWEWDPATEHLHVAPWLYTDYYYRTEEGRDTFVPISSEEARHWISRGIGDWDSPQLLQGRVDDVSSGRAMRPDDVG